MNRYLKAALAAAFIFGAASLADAALITVSGDLPATYITQGSTASGHFDINSALSGPGFSKPYNVVSGTMTFNFSDNSDIQTSYGVNSYTAQVMACLGSWCYPTNPPQYKFVVNTTTSNTSPYESVSVNSAGMTGSGATSYYYNSYTGPEVASGHMASSWAGGTYFVQDTHAVCTSWWGSTCFAYRYDPVYTISSTINSGYTGSFSIAMALNGLAISDLSNTGVLGFTVTGTAGDLYFNSASLDLTVNENTVAPATDPASVPEPSTLLLLGSGLAGLGFVRRRFKCKS